MADIASSKERQRDAAHVDAGLGVDRTSRPHRNLQFNRNKVSRIRGWHIPSLSRHDGTVLYIHVISYAIIICIRLTNKPAVTCRVVCVTRMTGSRSDDWIY
jgi:hypothetical protein